MRKGERIRFIVNSMEIPLEIVTTLAKVRNISISVVESKGNRLIFVAEKK